MHDTPRYVKEVQDILANFSENGEHNQGTENDLPPPENVIDMYIEDFAEEERITLIRKKPALPTTSDDERDLPDHDTAPRQPQPTTLAGPGIVPFALFVTLLCLFCIAVQINFLVHPFSVTVSLEARSQQLSLQVTVQLGRLLNPITISQSQTTPATGKGHQDARAATGELTFYNGSNVAQTINADTILTGQDGVQVATDQTVTVPAANLPQIGEVTVSAHAINAGSAGNIPASDISIALSNDLTVKNLTAFTGGQDERNFQTVAPGDITNTATPLQATLDQSRQNTLTGQLKSGEALTSQHCTQTTTSDHQPGQEATTVKVTVSETCSGIAYNSQELTNTVTQLLTAQAAKKLGSGYSLLENPQITVTSATTAKQVMLSFTSVSTWVYALSAQAQERIKHLIAGKTPQAALHILTSQSGIESASVAFSGFGDSSRIPEDTANIHILLFVA